MENIWGKKDADHDVKSEREPARTNVFQNLDLIESLHERVIKSGNGFWLVLQQDTIFVDQNSSTLDSGKGNGNPFFN